MSKNNTKSIIFLNPGEYFQAAVSGAVSTLQLRVSEHAQSYLVNLLSHHISMENFYPVGAEGKPNETLLSQLGSALEEERADLRAQRMRQLGDFSLYVAGFFADSLSRKLVDVDYYIGMGETAYKHVAHYEEKKSATLFLELANKFPQFVEILGQISDETGFRPDNHKDLLRVYELWLKTGSDRLAKQLARAGIMPTQVPKPPKDGTSGDS